MKLHDIDIRILKMITDGCTNDQIKSTLSNHSEVTEARIKLIRHKLKQGAI